MIFYRLYLDNLYQFKDFQLDFTIRRESKFSPFKESLKSYPELSYKKINIFMGANASGKTSIGKAMCLVQSFLGGKDIANLEFSPLKNEVGNQNENTKIDVVFSAGDYLYQLMLELDAFGVICENWRYAKLSDLAFKRNEEKLMTKEFVSYVRNETNRLSAFSSNFINEASNTHANNIKNHISFTYSFAGHHEKTRGTLQSIDVLEKIMISFDSSIKELVEIAEADDKYLIKFNNGHTEVINAYGVLSDKNSILSSGTKEAIGIASIVNGMQKQHFKTIYIDEQMSHSHPEMEKQIIQILMTLANKYDCQLIVTSHNIDLLDMGLPNYNYTLLKKNQIGEISELIVPESPSKHSIRSVRKLVEEDVFGTSPKLDGLIDLHEFLLEEEK